MDTDITMKKPYALYIDSDEKVINAVKFIREAAYALEVCNKVQRPTMFVEYVTNDNEEEYIFKFPLCEGVYFESDTVLVDTVEELVTKAKEVAVRLGVNLDMTSVFGGRFNYVDLIKAKKEY